MTKTLPVVAPWRGDFLSQIGAMESPILSLSSLHQVKHPSSSSPHFVPRCRTVLFRGMWAGLPINPKNTAELNPASYESDLLTITVDARMEKTPDLFQGTYMGKIHPGGSGPVEAVFWIPETRTQWRFRGRAYMIGPQIDSDASAPIRKAISNYMRPTGNQGGEHWSWGRELTAHFGNLSPSMRGSFRNPPPGTPLSEKPGDGLGLGQKVEDLHDVIARKHFRVVIIVPEEVDRLDLADPVEGRRWNYTFEGDTTGSVSWKTVRLWP